MNKYGLQVLRLLLLCCGFGLTLQGLALGVEANAAKAVPEPAKAAEAKPVRVGGDYLVTAVDHLSDREFHVEFTAVTPTGKFDVLHLHSDHVHIAVKKGEKLRLSAEILNSKGANAEVAQMVIFLPSNVGPNPVWLLSNRASNHELRAVKYLEMHSPQTDYVIM